MKSDFIESVIVQAVDEIEGRFCEPIDRTVHALESIAKSAEKLCRITEMLYGQFANDRAKARFEEMVDRVTASIPE